MAQRAAAWQPCDHRQQRHDGGGRKGCLNKGKEKRRGDFFRVAFLLLILINDHQQRSFPDTDPGMIGGVMVADAQRNIAGKRRVVQGVLPSVMRTLERQSENLDGKQSMILNACAKIPGILPRRVSAWNRTVLWQI